MSNSQRRINPLVAGMVSLAVMCSRVLGLIRELTFAALFGAGKHMDAFFIAFKTPNLLRDLFAEGALSMAFVTTFSKKLATEGEESAWQLANKILTLAAVFMSGISLLGILLAPWLIQYVIAPGFDPEKAALTILLTRIMFPFILLVSLAAVVMGLLNSKNVFGIPALASSFFNLGSIIGGVSLAWWIDPAFGPMALVGLALGTLIGGLLQLVVQFPSLRKIGYRFRPDFLWRDDGVRRVLLLMAPAVIAASAVQVNVLVNAVFASYLEDGAVSWLQFAFRLMQLPIGVFGVAIGVVTLPLISRAAATGPPGAFREGLAYSLRLAFFLAIPSAVGLILMAEPIVSLIFERMRFTAFDTEQTAAALQFYAVGLAAYAAIKVLVPAFYAVDRKNTPMMVSFGAIGTNFFLCWFLAFYLGLGHRGLALSTGVVATINFLVLYFLMWRHSGGLESYRLLSGLLKIGLATVPLGLVCVYANRWWDYTTLGLMEKLIFVTGSVGLAAAAYFLSAWLLRLPELHDLLRLAAGKLFRSRK